MGVLSVSWKERDGVLKGIQHKDTYEDVGSQPTWDNEASMGLVRSSKEKEDNYQSPGRTELWEKGAIDGSHGLGGTQPPTVAE